MRKRRLSLLVTAMLVWWAFAVSAIPVRANNAALTVREPDGGPQALKGDSPTTSPWRHSQVTPSGEGEALAARANGEIGVSYFRDGSVYVARRAGDSWEICDPLAIVDEWAVTALAFDAQDTAHLVVSTYTTLTQQMFYARHTVTEGWSEPVLIDPKLTAPTSIAIAIGPDDGARITYCTQNRANMALELWYVEMRPEGDVWIKTPVGQEGCWSRTAVAVDGNGHTHIVYYSKRGSAWNGTLKVVKRDGNVWHFDAVDGADTGFLLSLAVTRAGVPVIAYTYDDFLHDWSDTHREVRVATQVDGAWQLETLATMTAAQFFRGGLSLALDRYDRPHVAYVDQPADTLVYARPEGDDQWTRMPIGAAASIESRALVVDNAGTPHVAYRDASGGILVADLTLESKRYMPLLD